MSFFHDATVNLTKMASVTDWVQAITAVIILWLTYQLIRITRMYAKDTNTMVRLEARAFQYNAVSSELDDLQEEQWVKKEKQVYRLYMENYVKNNCKQNWKEYFQQMDEDDHEILREVTRRYNRLGALVSQGVIAPEGEKVIFVVCDDAIIRLWKALLPWIQYQRKRIRTQASYARGFQNLAQAAIDYHCTNRANRLVLYHPDEKDRKVEVYSPE